MLRPARLLLPLTAVLALAPATASHAAGKTATFTGVFEAKRELTWNQPRGVHLKDCKGDHYYEASGADSTVVKTRKPFKVTVQQIGGIQAWTFGKGMTADPRNFGIEAGGRTTREFTSSGGTTGGWCGGGDPSPKPEDDCGTRLPTWLVILQAGAGKLSFTMSHAPWMQHEKLSYYDCTVVPPEGMSEATFGLDKATYKPKDVFNKRKKTLTIGASETYGPDRWPVPNMGVERTAAGLENFKLTLTRTK